MEMEMQYLEREKIQEEQWNACIERSSHPLVYGYSWYLDAMTEQWGALILGDYQAVFPLVYRKKYGIYYLYQPFFTQQLGLFNTLEKNNISIDAVLHQIPKKFKFWDIQVHGEIVPKTHFYIPKTTFHLSLNHPYEFLAKQYNKDARKSIRKANAEHWKLKESQDLHTILNDYQLAYGDLNNKIESHQYLQFKKAIEEGLKRGKVHCYFLLDANEKRMASGVFFRSKNMLHYNLGAPTTIGRSQNAIHILLDEIIKLNANKDLILDFEGSEIPSVAYFYKKFGVTPYTYYHIKNNRLPFPFSLLKK